jgi:hypothetical protein
MPPRTPKSGLPAQPPESPVTPLLRIEEASQVTGLSCRQLRLAVRKGRLAAFRPSGFARGRLAFAQADLAEFVNAARLPGGAR